MKKEVWMARPPGHGRTLSHYQFGFTSLFASRADQRFSYCLYVPDAYDEDGTDTYPLAVVMHGTERGAQAYRDAFAPFAEQHGCIVLAPLFPCGIDEAGELDNYKYIDYHGIRFDEVLLSIVEEIAQIYRVDAARFLMHGFSGGGHFTHRFLYLHPGRLLGASIGAPGVVTLLDEGLDYWAGVRDLEQRFGIPLDLDAMRSVPIQMVIGAQDTDTWEIALSPDDDDWVEGAEHLGATRLERLAALKESFERHGIPVQHDIVDGADHDGFLVLEPVEDFFAGVLRSIRAGGR